jgi:hypothetical protein
MVSVLFVQMTTSVFPLASEIQTSPKGLWAGRLNAPLSLQVSETVFYPERCGAGGHCHSRCRSLLSHKCEQQLVSYEPQVCRKCGSYKKEKISKTLLTSYYQYDNM